MKLDSDRIIGLSAMLVGLSSLFVSVYQTHLLHESQNASVLPYLMVGLSSNEDGVYLNTYNTGIGPAMVDDVVIHYQGKERHQDPFDFYVAERPGPGTAVLSVDRMFRGRLIPAGQQVQMLGIGRSQTTDVQKHFMQELLGLIEVADVPRLWLSNSGLPLVSKDRAVVEITFSSVYGERWHVRSDEMVTTRR